MIRLRKGQPPFKDGNPQMTQISQISQIF